MIYCENRRCTLHSCKRHMKNSPKGDLFETKQFQPDSNQACGFYTNIHTDQEKER